MGSGPLGLAASPSEMVGGFYTPSGDAGSLIADEMMGSTRMAARWTWPATGHRPPRDRRPLRAWGLLGGDFQRAGGVRGLEATDPKVAAAFARIPRDTSQNQRRERALAYYIQQNFDQLVALMIASWRLSRASCVGSDPIVSTP